MYVFTVFNVYNEVPALSILTNFMAIGYRSAIDSIAVSFEPMSDQNDIANPMVHISKAADAAEDAVKACERLHLDRLRIYSTLDEFERVFPDCQRLLQASKTLISIIERKWDIINTARNGSETSIEPYTKEPSRSHENCGLDDRVSSLVTTSDEDYHTYTHEGDRPD